MATGKAHIDSLMYDLGKVQTLTADTNYRVVALDWLNRVVRDLAGRNPHWFWLEKTSTFDTVADQMSYDVPSDLEGQNIYNLKQTTSPTSLTYIDQRRLDELEPDPTDASGNPFYYTLFATAVRLWPVPSDAIEMTIRYLKTPTAFTDGAGSTSDIPARYDQIVNDGMKVHAFNYEPQWGNSKVAQVSYEAGIVRMQRDNNVVLNDDGVTERHPFGGRILKEPFSFDKTDVF